MNAASEESSPLWQADGTKHTGPSPSHVSALFVLGLNAQLLCCLGHITK